MRITVLIDNERPVDRPDLACELGLSLLVEHRNHHILFDTGASSAFADNAAVLGVDLSRVDAVVISHDHFDHGGGLRRFLELNHRAPIYLRAAPHRDRFFRILGFVKKPIGIEPSALEAAGDRLVPIDDDREIAPGVVLTTRIASDHARPPGNRYLWEVTDDGPRRDTFDHELTMVVLDDDADMVVFTGCSHNGVLNMVDGAREAFPDRSVHAVVGGFHLMGLPFLNTMAAGRDEVLALGRTLGEVCTGPIITGHCTGLKATAVLRKPLGDRLRTLSTAQVFDI
jgi:7,8-dihydropterin-6-yl-methyl-4-(beta-D-ribofuranosyl)aminobenzene 5'-phosphate synthase